MRTALGPAGPREATGTVWHAPILLSDRMVVAASPLRVPAGRRDALHHDCVCQPLAAEVQRVPRLPKLKVFGERRTLLLVARLLPLLWRALRDVGHAAPDHACRDPWREGPEELRVVKLG